MQSLLLRLGPPTLLTCALLCALACGGCTDVSPDGPRWEPAPREVALGRSPELLVRASGEIAISYAAPAERGYDLLYVRSDDGGDHFSPPQRLNATPGAVLVHGESGPQLRGGHSGTYAAWAEDEGLQLAASLDFGASFQPPVRVVESTALPYFALGTGHGGVYLAWLDSRDRATVPPGTMSLYVARSADRGKTFGTVRVAGGVCPCCRPAVLASGQQVWVAWRHVFEEGARDIALARSEDGGQSWSEPLRVAVDDWRIDGCPHSGPDLARSGDELRIAWHTAAQGESELKLARSSDGGKSFAPPTLLQGSVLDANHAALAGADTELGALFQGRDPAEREGFGKLRAWWAAAEGSEPRPLPSGGGSVSNPQLHAGRGEHLYAVWAESSESGARVMLLRGRAATSPALQSGARAGDVTAFRSGR
jgi:hypothetical protein